MVRNRAGRRVSGQPAPLIVRLLTKLTFYNTLVRLLLLGACWLLWPTVVAGLNYGVLAGIIVLSFLVDLGYVHLLLRPLRVLVNQKLWGVEDPAQFDFTPLMTTTLDLGQLDNRINELMRQINTRIDCEKAFASHASHELLTPIAVLQNRFDNLIADEQTPVRVAAHIVESQQILLRLSNIVQMLLRLARIENHQYIKNETVSIRTVLLAVLDDLDDRITLKRIKVELAFDKDIIVMRANHALLHTMLLNLVGNAIRYSNEGGRLTIGRGRFSGGETLTITDTGPGMTPEQIATLTQYGRPGKATGDGNGIGLQLIRTIAEFHQATLSVDSQPDQGTCITLRFIDNQ